MCKTTDVKVVQTFTYFDGWVDLNFIQQDGTTHHIVRGLTPALAAWLSYHICVHIQSCLRDS
jgi:hypothetical protein